MRYGNDSPENVGHWGQWPKTLRTGRPTVCPSHRPLHRSRAHRLRNIGRVILAGLIADALARPNVACVADASSGSKTGAVLHRAAVAFAGAVPVTGVIPHPARVATAGASETVTGAVLHRAAVAIAGAGPETGVVPHPTRVANARRTKSGSFAGVVPHPRRPHGGEP